MPSLTPQQAAAVQAEGNVLVMAGAGTGKTSTLVARVVDRLTRPEGRVRADRLLMVTFTEAAALEMRSRLRRELEARRAEAPGDSGLREQLLRLEFAQIGTLHAFCLSLLREHGLRIGLEPQVAVIDEVELGGLKAELLRELTEPLFAGEDPGSRAFQDLVRSQFRGDLQAVAAGVKSVHAYARTVPDPRAWLAQEAARWADSEPTAWRSWLADFARIWAVRWRGRLAGVTENPNATRRYGALTTWVQGGADFPSFGELVEALAELPDEEWPKRRKTVCRAPLKSLFPEVEFLRSIQPRPGEPDPLQEDFAVCRGRMGALVALVREFETVLAAEKRRRGVVDFSDLEQLALDLLVRGDGSVAAACRERYEWVVVDECQDLNGAQEAVLRAVSREGAGANRFLVGDVKQSIYRFRLADPHLFQRTADEWSQPGAPGQVLPLTGNFRSAEGVLAFVNRVFPRLMRREVGGVEYGPEAALVFGDPEGRAALARSADREPRVECHILAAEDPVEEGEGRAGEGAGDSPESGAGEEAMEPVLSAGRQEARLVAARFAALRAEGLPVWDRSAREFRPVRWSDMAVLLRAERERAAEYVAEFAAAGIPLQARQNGFFLRLEVSDLLAVLKCLDNPLQDIPVLAVLRSPLVGLDDLNELAAVRMYRRREHYWWDLLAAYREAGAGLGLRADDPTAGPAEGEATPLTDADGRPILEGEAVFTHPVTREVAALAWHRLERWLTWYPEWRRCAERRGVVAALEQILDDTQMEQRWAATEGGEAALANVRRFLALAQEFERGQRGGLYRFLRWLADEAEADRIEAATGAAGEAVQLMTVHRSKGLEFPVVAVGGLGRRFNLSELRTSQVVRDEVYGLCPLVVMPEGRSYPSLPLWLAQRRQRREILGEELRLLYVALTRAADRLLLVGSASPKAVNEHWPTRGASLGESPLPTEWVEEAVSPLDWLGPCLVGEIGPAWTEHEAGRTEFFHWRRWTAPPVVTPVAPVAAEAPPPEAPSEAPYPYQAATAEPAKVTVTGLRKRLAAEQAEDAAPWRPHGGSSRAEPGDVSAVERGVLHHRFLEFVDFARAKDEEGVVAEVARLRMAGRFNELEAAALDVPALGRFGASTLGDRLRAAGSWVRRELPFTLRLETADLRRLGLGTAERLAEDEFLVAQGVVDLVVMDPAGAWLLDYKTDRVTPGESTALKVVEYRPQLEVYALAIRRIFGVPVRGGWLHFLATGESVEAGIEVL